jgi:hypothetical protein
MNNKTWTRFCKKHNGYFKSYFKTSKCCPTCKSLIIQERNKKIKEANKISYCNKLDMRHYCSIPKPRPKDLNNSNYNYN